jgi:pSer/pThr/pTyr-binding forkhead associated (FHA) protein
MNLIIEDDEGRKTVVPVARDEITIGRQEGNTVRLMERNVSRRHARLRKDQRGLLIEDLGSFNGVRVNGEKIRAPTPIGEGDRIEIGDYDLGIEGSLEAVDPAFRHRFAEETVPEEPLRSAPPISEPGPMRPTRKPLPGAALLSMAALAAAAIGAWVLIGRHPLRQPEVARGEAASAPQPQAVTGATAPPPDAPAAGAPAPTASPPVAPDSPPAAHPSASTSAQRPPSPPAAPTPPRVAAGPRPVPPLPQAPAAKTSAPAAPQPSKLARAAPKNAAQAVELAQSSADKLADQDFQGAIADAQAALSFHPADADTLALAYRSLGYGYAFLNDTGTAKRYLREFRPYCEKFGAEVCAQVDQFLAK